MVPYFRKLGDSFWCYSSTCSAQVCLSSCPNLVRWRWDDEGQNPLQVRNTWLRVKSCREQVEVWWTGYSVIGSFRYVLAWKLKALEKDLKAHNKEMIGLRMVPISIMQRCSC